MKTLIFLSCLGALVLAGCDSTQFASEFDYQSSLQYCDCNSLEAHVADTQQQIQALSLALSAPVVPVTPAAPKQSVKVNVKQDASLYVGPQPNIQIVEPVNTSTMPEGTLSDIWTDYQNTAVRQEQLKALQRRNQLEEQRLAALGRYQRLLRIAREKKCAFLTAVTNEVKQPLDRPENADRE